MKIYFSDTNESYVENKQVYYPIEIENQAIQNLKGTSVFLWFYLIKHGDKQPFICRPVDIGLPRVSFDRAIEELIEQKYLVPYKEGSYMFYEIPKEEN